ncbi:SH3 domain-containing protein [Oscillatoriales cyanobacterium LEGE 11467]|uniref:SH3 domain-containing protein n=1 Tax=Zarconia navalis LEGE 11467 TaxID=1828826 RepID=A0A928VW54_9CYAN|nr:SH3 domain-containing protein [Zarconia navalis]MBE9040398.1 SH3 domain-containing protein [Zarconia navalis LEGE 11467]
MIKNYDRRSISIALAASLSLFSIAPAMAQNPKPIPQRTPVSSNQPESCRRVNISENSYLNVRLRPGGKVVGTLSDRDLVTIEERTEDGWIPISSPFSGYVYGDYLTFCDTPLIETTPIVASSCRQVSAAEGMEVYQRPSLNGDILGRVVDGQEVTIVDRGENGWVPISEPVNGYILGVGLVFCPE